MCRNKMNPTKNEGDTSPLCDPDLESKTSLKDHTNLGCATQDNNIDLTYTQKIEMAPHRTDGRTDGRTVGLVT